MRTNETKYIPMHDISNLKFSVADVFLKCKSQCVNTISNASYRVVMAEMEALEPEDQADKRYGLL